MNGDNEPGSGALIFDSAGNAYGTTVQPFGSIYELARQDGWTLSNLYTFDGGVHGRGPSGLVSDPAGNLYGTTQAGGTSNCGTIFELSLSQGLWTLTTLYNFQCGSDGQSPRTGLIRDSAGNLFGSTNIGGAQGGGTLFELSPSGGSWVLATLYSFTGQGGPVAPLTMDDSGNLYGTTLADGLYDQGSVFTLTKLVSGWNFANLHDFSGASDGGTPLGGVVIGRDGDLYGTTTYGGSGGTCSGRGCGVLWKITP